MTQQQLLISSPYHPSSPLILQGLAFQNLSGQLGLVTGQDLAQHCGKRYPKFARVLLWLLLEIAIVGTLQIC